MLEVKHQSKGLVSHGVSACAGCGLEIVMRSAMRVLGEDTMIIIPPGCAALFSGFGKETALKIPGFQGNLENSAACASGLRAALNAKGNTHTKVLAFAGDGATVDIGIQALSGVLERRDKVIYICYDNEAYMNTGIQSSSSTPQFASTTTTPAGKNTGRKDLVQIAISHDIPYAATASIYNIKDLERKIEKASEVDGPSLVHVHAPCPTGWRYDPSKTIQVARAAVETGCWIQYEYENGKYTLNYNRKALKPIEEYVGLQGRFKKMSAEDKKTMQENVKAHFDKYTGKMI
ncbi:thiamine pyrophosphate-dependent enzyme [Fusibacter ferrireducens]|uniref:Pyruvate synthase subunit beta n=1 Tax=Fusibacter ferrireducens TaxID=2785058 RepID=A0ABR9ZNY9_9FIRM|nr:thiamine pyrophosphate-dependent enzyme [Fusibacter ferrireducens]MBF4692183.1 pyruvate synthase subunit beta [Fusibacter ferrireducens]